MKHEPLKPCPICGSKVDWCDCGKCHQIQCKSCGLQVDNNAAGNASESLEGTRDDIRRWWNGRADKPVGVFDVYDDSYIQIKPEHADETSVELYASPQLSSPDIRHSPDCRSTEHGVAFCEGMYAEKCDDVLKLQDALRAVYALAGEDPQIAKIVHETLRETGGEY